MTNHFVHIDFFLKALINKNKMTNHELINHVYYDIKYK